MFVLDESLHFPDHVLAHDDGLLAIGGDLSVDRLLKAYRSGIFPWYGEKQPILWWSPDPRSVIFPEKIKISKSMRKVLRADSFSVTYDQNFLEVILACKRIPREGQAGTWITNDMIEAYLNMHESGHARSVEVWQDEKLVGGLYGIDLPGYGIFCGESMFSRVSNASKVGLIMLSRKLQEENYNLIDCQIHTPHLASMGAEEIPRGEFLNYFKAK